MPYTDKFVAADDLVAHVSLVLPSVTDLSLQAKYAGFLSVSAVTVYELAIKEIFIEFATRKHKAYGIYVEQKFERINGRIKLKDLKDEHVKSFGVKYLEKFKRNIDHKEKIALRTMRYSIQSSYGNLIVCRHNFVHEGNPTLSANEVIDSYNRGKQVLVALYESMQR